MYLMHLPAKQTDRKQRRKSLDNLLGTLASLPFTSAVICEANTGLTVQCVLLFLQRSIVLRNSHDLILSLSNLLLSFFPK